jgi:S-adenosylmethionine:tRNA ribosyltransferase-isomerase
MSLAMSSSLTGSPDLAADYDYDLPKELIAQQPLAVRSDSRLLVVDRRRQTIEHRFFRDLVEYLQEGDALVLNDSRVVPAKLTGYRKDTRGRWHGLWLENEPVSEFGTHVLRVLCKTRSALQPGHVIVLQDRNGRDHCELVMLTRLGDGVWAAKLNTELPVEQVLKEIGRVPLPHYIRGGNMIDSDVQDYQTVFAKNPGSVAAPTAGLHLTQAMVRQLVDSGIALCPVTLHVGLGTFRPIAGDRLSEHRMHAESGWLTAETATRLNKAREAGRRIVAVGTTAVRVLESASDPAGALGAWQGRTDLFIRPGHTFRAVDALVTNFHLPRSTLLVLVRTFGGDALIRRAYQEAVAQRYRFFSYGDAMLVV